MNLVKTEELPVRVEEDVVRVRQVARQWSEGARFSLVEQTKIVTAASELARNTFVHGGGGVVRIELLDDGARSGLRLTFSDEGPGIPDVQAALRDGFTTGTGLGLGLGGSRRLMSDFAITSKPGAGTKVTITRWK